MLRSGVLDALLQDAVRSVMGSANAHALTHLALKTSITPQSHLHHTFITPIDKTFQVPSMAPHWQGEL
jgi:hypothetical protein